MDRKDVVEGILERAAENAGDITAPVMALFYQRFPEAREMFAHHGSHRLYSLEGEMVEQALYCLMYWFQSPWEVEMVLMNSVPHHNDTLKVPPAVYQGLLTATSEVIRDTIPEGHDEEKTAWDELCDNLAGVIEQSSQFISQPAREATGEVE